MREVTGTPIVNDGAYQVLELRTEIPVDVSYTDPSGTPVVRKATIQCDIPGAATDIRITKPANFYDHILALDT